MITCRRRKGQTSSVQTIVWRRSRTEAGNSLYSSHCSSPTTTDVVVVALGCVTIKWWVDGMSVVGLIIQRFDCIRHRLESDPWVSGPGWSQGVIHRVIQIKRRTAPTTIIISMAAVHFVIERQSRTTRRFWWTVSRMVRTQLVNERGGDQVDQWDGIKYNYILANISKTSF